MGYGTFPEAINWHELCSRCVWVQTWRQSITYPLMIIECTPPCTYRGASQLLNDINAVVYFAVFDLLGPVPFCILKKRLINFQFISKKMSVVCINAHWLLNNFLSPSCTQTGHRWPHPGPKSCWPHPDPSPLREGSGSGHQAPPLAAVVPLLAREYPLAAMWASVHACCEYNIYIYTQLLVVYVMLEHVLTIAAWCTFTIIIIMFCSLCSDGQWWNSWVSKPVWFILWCFPVINRSFKW